GDGDLQIAATDDRREVEVAEGRVVDGVDKDTGGFGFGEHGAVDGGIVGGGDGEELRGEIAVLVFAEMQRNLARVSERGDAVIRLGRDDGDARVRGEQRFDLRLSELARADDGAWARGELEEDGEERHHSGL